MLRDDDHFHLTVIGDFDKLQRMMSNKRLSPYKQRLFEYLKNPARCVVCEKPIPMRNFEIGSNVCGSMCGRKDGYEKRKWNFEHRVIV